MNNKTTHVLLIGLAVFASAFGYLNGFQALNLSYMDTSVNAGDDFYTYVNGKWMETSEIPSDRGRWGSFDKLGKKADSMALKVLDEAAEKLKSTPKSAAISQAPSDQEKAILLYQTVIE